MSAQEGLVEQLREYTAIRYAGDCKCGKCRLVPREVIDETMARITSLESENARLLTVNAGLLSACQPFIEVLENDVGSDETDEDRFMPISVQNARAPLLTIGHFRRLAAALAGHEQAGATMTAEQMREACAEAAKDRALAWYNGEAQTLYGQGYQAGCYSTRDAIRAIPASPGKGAE